MISFEKFKEQVTLGYMSYENKLCVTMFFNEFYKHIDVQINVFTKSGQFVNMPFDKLKVSISEKINEWYNELKNELEKLYPDYLPHAELQDKLI